MADEPNETAPQEAAPLAAENGKETFPPQVDLPAGNPVVPSGAAPGFPPAAAAPPGGNPVVPAGADTFPPKVKAAEDGAPPEEEKPKLEMEEKPAADIPVPPAPSAEQIKAAEALRALAQQPQTSHAMLDNAEKAEEYFKHLAVIAGEKPEKAKADFVLGMQSFLKAKEAELAPEKKKEEQLEAEEKTLESQAQELAKQGKAASIRAMIVTGIGTAALAVVGWFSGKKLPVYATSPKLTTAASVVIGSGVGGGVFSWASAHIFGKPIKRKGEELQGRFQQYQAEKLQFQQHVESQVSPALNGFIASYIESALERSGVNMQPAMAEPTSSLAPAKPTASSAIADILAGGPAASYAAQAEKSAAAAAVGGRA